MYIIFLCIVPLAAVTTFSIYYFRRHLKTWWMTKARKAAIKYVFFLIKMVHLKHVRSILAETKAAEAKNKYGRSRRTSASFSVLLQLVR